MDAQLIVPDCQLTYILIAVVWVGLLQRTPRMVDESPYTASWAGGGVQADLSLFIGNSSSMIYTPQLIAV